MIDSKFRFRVLLLLVFLAALACENKKSAPGSAGIEKLIVEAKQGPPETQLQNVNAAYGFAQNQNEKVLLQKAFNAKYNILKSHFPDSIPAFLNKYRQDAESAGDTLNEANAYYELANRYVAAGKPDTAFRFYNASKQKYELLKDSLQVAEKLLLMAQIYNTSNDYIGVESSTTEMLGFLANPLRNATDTIYAAIARNNYGLAYWNLYDYDSALENYGQAAALSKDPFSLKTIENNKAVVYMDMGKYEKALSILIALKDDSTVAGNPQLHARVLDNLGYSLFKTNRQGALEQLQHSLAIREKEKDDFGSVASNIHLSDYYSLTDWVLAKRYALRGYELATALHSPDDRLFALQALRKNTSGAALEGFSSLFISIKDSIGKVRQQARNQFAKIRYDSRQATAENLKLKAETAEKALQLEKKKRQADMLYSGLGFLLLFGAMLYFVLRKRHREEKIREGTRSEARIAKKVHDELANDMFNAMTFAETQDLSDIEKRETLISTLDSVYSRTRDISRESNPVDTGERFPDLLRDMLSEYSSPGINVLIQGLDAIHWHTMSENKKTVTWRTLQELMVNMRKHSGASLAAVRFKEEGKAIRIHYSDNGLGMPEGKAHLKNGLQNVENRIDAIGGTVTFETEPGKGVRIALSWPV